MTTLTINLSKDAEKELEKDLKHLETITKKPSQILHFWGIKEKTQS